MSGPATMWTPERVDELRKCLEADMTIPEIVREMSMTAHQIYRCMSRRGLRLSDKAAARRYSTNNGNVGRRNYKVDRKLLRPGVPLVAATHAAEAAHYLRRFYNNVFPLRVINPTLTGLWRIGRVDVSEAELVERALARGFKPPTVPSSL